MSYLWFLGPGAKVGPWGTYRPNVYFGVKRRAADSPLMGMAWLNPDTEWWESIRHDAEERDGLARYGYLEHTGDKYGSQEIIDEKGGMFLRTSFVRTEDDRWAVRVSGLPINPDDTTRNTSIFWYVALQNNQDGFGFPTDFNIDGIGGDINVLMTISGKEYRMTIPREPTNIYPTVVYSKRNKVHLNKASFLGMIIEENVWDAKKIVKQALMNDATRIYKEWQAAHSKSNAKGPSKLVARLQNVADPAANFLVIQQFFTLPFTFDVVFQPQESWQPSYANSESVSGRLLDEAKAFEDRFTRTFQLAERGFNKSQQQFAQAALCNLLGGIGHFHGNTLVQYGGKEEQEVGPIELFTAVPSRSFFPRGFLWDEGFHQLLVAKWDQALSQDILKHWFALVDSDGWIQREVIAGEEARRRVPREFQTQKPHIANPPTLLLAVRELMHNSKNQTQLTEFLREIYPAVQRYVAWYVRTQASKGAGEWTDPNSARTFRWAGRTVGHCLASGLDDYPRASWITEQEGHVDLHSWMVVITRTVGEIARFLGHTSEAEKMLKHSAAILDALNEMHWNEKHQMYCDYSYRDNSKHWICHEGYISLFPFMLQLISPSAPQLKASLDLLSDPTKLWSDYGILSLSKKDKFFGKDENYWRGNIWLNLNFLSLRALHYYGTQEGPYRELSSTLEARLRSNLIQNLHLRYHQQGFLFEQYSWKDGKGLRTHPFTGWTATAAVLAMSEAPALAK